jgi:hypothetical protein
MRYQAKELPAKNFNRGLERRRHRGAIAREELGGLRLSRTPPPLQPIFHLVYVEVLQPI